MTDPSEYIKRDCISWCKGCSFHSVLHSIAEVLSISNTAPSDVNIISGIGCSSRLPFFLNTFGMHTLHGRAIAVACGARLARPDIPVIVAAGDGDMFSIGLSHFVNAANKNFNMTVLCMDNRMFAMTKNQSSPTSDRGHAGSMTPFGKTERKLNVNELAIVSGATFVAQVLATEKAAMTDILRKAFIHKGFSFVHILSDCMTFGDKLPASLKPDIVNLDSIESFDPLSRSQALEQAQKAHEAEETRITNGIFWISNQPVFEEQA